MHLSALLENHAKELHFLYYFIYIIDSHKHVAHVARMPTERNAMEYNMNHKRRGLALIFNHEFFDIPSLESRKGTNADCEKLKKAFKKLDFEVTDHKDCKLRELLEWIEKGKKLENTKANL